GHRRQGPQRRGARPLPRARRAEAGSVRTAGLPRDPHRRRAHAREEPAPVRPLPAGGDHVQQQGPDHPGRGQRRRLLRRPGHRRPQARGPSAQGARPSPGPPRPAHPCVGRRGDGGAAGRRSPRGEQQRPRRRPRRRGGRPARARRLRPDRRRRHRQPDRARQDPRRSADDQRRRPARDGARRSRLLPLHGRRHRPAERGLPAARLRLRRHPAADEL
ncbi:MAG: Ribosome hibernation promoting factor Hpf, partial [uncultured Frankineae bacterium]